jgi:flagellar hook-associated protein 1 FlgK
MSLFGTIQTANTGLQASQLGLQVVGNNVANSSTPGYIRQRLELETNPATRQGGLLIGNGVRPTGITQLVDKALMERMFTAGSDKAAGEVLNRAYEDLENLVGSLSGGLRESMTSFNNSLHDLSATPNDRSLRDFVILQGESLAREIRSTFQSIITLQVGVNAELDDVATSINEKIAGIAKLNVAISSAEGGGAIRSDAAGLREQRYGLIEELSALVDINIQEQATGSISVFVGGDFLVAEGIHREVEKSYNNELGGFELRIRQSQAALKATSGRYGALLRSREEVFGSFVNDLDALASALSITVNEIHSQGQGRKGFDSLLSNQSGLIGVPLRNAQLAPAPTNGSFEIQLVDSNGSPVSFNRIDVRETNQVTDSTIDSVVADINAIDGLSAVINSDGKIEIRSTSPGTSFTFANDTSGFLKSVGFNTFFVGSTAKDIDINPVLKANSDFLAISRSGISGDTTILTELVDVIDRPLESLSGRSVQGLYNESVAKLGQRISLQRSITQGANDLHSLLTGQHLGITGVNLDEESIKMLAYNRTFQANARVITTANEMLEILMQI